MKRFTMKRQVSLAGGVQPHWRADGRELFYLALDGTMMSVPVTPGADLLAVTPTALFRTNIDPNPAVGQYGVTPDGQRFLGLDAGPRRPDGFTFLLNWLTPGPPGAR